jgi:dUTP pyrophosphatase
MNIQIKKISEDAKIPTRATDGSAGYDLYAHIQAPLTISPLERQLIPTGVSLSIPDGFVGLVCPRSGLALKQGLTVLNAPGVIDSDYRGEVQIILINLGSQAGVIEPANRVAQLLIMPVMEIQWTPVQELNTSPRGVSGFGSSDNLQVSGQR